MSDHFESHRELFEKHKIESMIEFGLGEGTKFFLEQIHLKEVLSVELYTKDKELAKKLPISTDEWMKKFGREFVAYKNWGIFPYNCGESILKAEHDVTGHGKVERGADPTTKEYLKEIQKLINKLFKNNKYDYAFVDPGIHLRGDIVNALFGKVKIIGAHDTNTKPLYGYNRIVVPLDYSVEENTNGEGITFWKKHARV